MNNRFKTYQFIGIILIAFKCSLPLIAQDSLHHESRNLPDKKIFKEIYSQSAARAFSPDAFAHGDIGVVFNSEKMDDLHFIQEGDKLNEYGLQAKGLTLKNNTIFWGKIGYNNFHRKNVQWSDVYDFRRVGPYIIADSIGGAMQGEEYSLSGGISLKYDRWIFGGELSYTAGQVYRKTDPRPRSTATDLDFTLSASYAIGLDYQLGASFNMSSYREDIQISVGRQNTNYDFFLMKPFGNYRPRISKYYSSFSWYYNGKTYGGGVFLVPHNKTGLLADFNVSRTILDSDVGSTKPVSFNTNKVLAVAGWQWWNNRQRSFIKLSYNRESNIGVERIYYYMNINDVFGQSFLLTANKYYSKKIAETKLTIGREWLSGKNAKWIFLDGGFSSYDEVNFYPVYELSFKQLFSSINIGGEFTKSKSTFIPQISLMYRRKFGDTKERYPEDLKTFHLSYAPNIDYLMTDMWGVNVNFGYEYKIKGNIKIYTTAQGQMLIAKNNKHRSNLNLSIGVKY